MKKSIATVVFMVLISVVFLSVLATVNEMSKHRIARNQDLRFLRSVLYACGLLPEGFDEWSSPNITTDSIPWNEAAIDSSVRDHIQRIRLFIPHEMREIRSAYWGDLDSTDLYLIRGDEGLIVSFGFLMRGKGLWGSISAFAAVNRSLDRMLGLDFIDQSETPGLGARITESSFKFHFRNLRLAGEGGEILPVVMVGAKESSNIEKSTNRIQSITGATQTCNGVLEMLNRELPFYMRLIAASMERIEGI